MQFTTLKLSFLRLLTHVPQVHIHTHEWYYAVEIHDKQIILDIYILIYENMLSVDK